MIQNIPNYNNEKVNSTSENNTAFDNINFREMFSKLFTIPNIIIYILTLMISMVSLGPNSTMVIAPFGLALVFALLSNGMPILMVYLSSLIGTAIKFRI